LLADLAFQFADALLGNCLDAGCLLPHCINIP
jgi:hypothetical protein